MATNDNFPEFISFTVTNACNLRCRMCGQWSEDGYVKKNTKQSTHQAKMGIDDWIRLVDEISNYRIRFILIRGGEPFLFPHIMDLLRYIHNKGIFISLDTNGTYLEKYVEEVVQLGNMHITFSIDGPEEIHDYVRGVNGSFKQTKKSIELLNMLDKNNKISRSICFTISQYSFKGLGKMPEVARSVHINSINIVPYYYVSAETGKKYENELREHFNLPAYSWKGFHHNNSGVDIDRLLEELKAYKESLNGIENFPYMPLTEEEYKIWFSDDVTPVGSLRCNNVENLIDIQPDGGANFCVDYPDYSFGNVKEATIQELWNSTQAQKFREYRRKQPLAVCYRCGGKYISELKG
ncbi:MAG: radical SAM protein [Bacteroidetes bacterium]|nr:radical SAM protein [Bacteroidota bacterium]